VVSSSSPRVKLDLLGICFVCHSAWTGRNAVLGQWPKGVVDWLSVSHHHSTRDGAIWFLTVFAESINLVHCASLDWLCNGLTSVSRQTIPGKSVNHIIQCNPACRANLTHSRQNQQWQIIGIDFLKCTKSS